MDDYLYILIYDYDHHKTYDDFDDLKKALAILDAWLMILRYNPKNKGWAQATIVAGQQKYAWKGIELHPDYPNRKPSWTPVEQNPSVTLSAAPSRYLSLIHDQPYLSPKTPSWADKVWPLSTFLTKNEQTT